MMRRSSTNKGALFGVLGAAAIALGVALILIGNYMNEDFYVNVEYYYAHGKWDSSGSTTMTLGIVAAAAGVVLLFVALYFAAKSRRKFRSKMHNQEYDEVDDVIAQMAGNKTIFDVFHSEDNSRTFSFYRDKTCILKSGDRVLRGTMEPLEWEAGHPTLWRILLDVDGQHAAYEIRKDGGDILVRGRSGEKRFYRN